MNAASPSDITIRVDSIDQLFNDPDIDPLSDKPSIVIGAAALPYTVRESVSRGRRDWRGKRLVIQLPPEQISADTSSVVARAVRCYSDVKIEDNNRRMRISRRRGMTGFGISLAFSAAVLLVAALLLNTVLAAAPDVVKGLATGVATIFIWATVWNPVDRLMFEWVEPWMENRALRTIASMDIVVQPENG